MQENLTKNIEKIVINVGVGKKSQDGSFENKILPEIEKNLEIITGQKPTKRKAKQSIAGFKLRAGQIVGLKVTLRKKRMEDFLLKLIHFTLPRVKDFRGINLKNIDQNGNLNIGFKEQFVFPEIIPEKVNVVFGLQVTIVPKEQKREKAIDFYRRIGIPLKK
jgi:large subunit ribosomal protein L5